ncbi:D-alanyl-D-alanine carboxypeptidase/D-alanyl-D-alanine-endopeptidase [Nocardioides vastitatis]|uniref:D-alanyl-D-alanine carboxypeptidase/D-alanyl-D-alanine-endopeptidase n=3 Tax=Nocardioides TaxID=1839 RepID=A0ABW0ZHD5_9ACTN
MARSDEERGSGRVRNAFAALVALAVVAAGGMAWQTGWAEEMWDRARGTDGPPADPASVAPPAGIDVPDVVLPPPLAQPATGSARLRPAALKAALAELGDRDLGRHVLAAVGPLDGRRIAYQSTEGAAVAIPASTTKIVTSAAALFLLGPDRVFETTTVLDTSATTPRLVLVGGGDPYLARRPAGPEEGGPSATYQPQGGDVATLARRSARALAQQGVRRVRLAYDDSLFTGPQAHPTWEADYIPDDVVTPITSLWVDQGREPGSFDRVADPAATAALEFRHALARNGIRVVGRTLRGAAPAGATRVGRVSSPNVAQIVQRVLESSDNEAAEVLLRHVGLADQGDGSFTGGQVAVERVLTANGIKLAGTVLYDGSGLSRANRIAPSLLLGVLRLAASPEHPALRPVLSSLPVAGFTGSLTNRMDRAPSEGRGRVRAKTGTLTGVTSLAGIAVDLDGNLMAFALLADRVRKPREGLARVAMDNAAASLGACHCGR